MKRVAIVGGGIAGLAAAYELEKQRRAGAAVDWQLYEASERLGGIVETTRLATPEGEYILEGGPDGWVSEKPWARELAVELGLEADLIYSNDATRKTYILINGTLQPMPDKMRMMVPEDLSTLDASPLFTAVARQAYADELASAESLRATAPDHDESVSSFVRRHFGDEVLTKIGAPLLSGVFGGDVARLSVRAVMPAFVAMEREHGSLIAGLQAKARARETTRGERTQLPIFTTLRRGLGCLVEAVVAILPVERLHLGRSATSLKREGALWCLRTSATDLSRGGTAKRHFHHVLLATPIDATRALLLPIDAEAAALVPLDASSSVLAAFCWPETEARYFTPPTGFGFLIPQDTQSAHQHSQMLACTFVDQKFPCRAPAATRILRAFFGGATADALTSKSDEAVTAMALQQLSSILGPLPTPNAALTTVRRWPRSLPQYEVGHLERMAQLDELVARIGNLTLLGNGYRGVGLPDLIHHARTAVRSLGLA